MSAALSAKVKTRIDSDLEKAREDGEWSKVLELADQIATDSSKYQLGQFLLGEAKLEIYLQGGERDGANLLRESKKHLSNCLNASNASPVVADANLLLSKHCFVSGDYSSALKIIDTSSINSVIQVEKYLPLRIMKLVAESFAIKGMCIEKEKSIEKREDKAANCLMKSTELTLRYLQNMEKHSGQYTVVPIGPILEKAMHRSPVLYTRSGHLIKACSYYRNIMNSCENASTCATRQLVSRQLAELLLHSISRSNWTPFDTSITTLSGHWKPHRYYGQSLFNPKEREEEIVLLLLISESLASRNVVLDRGPEFSESRTRSLETVMAIYDLLVINLTPCKYYSLDMFEKAMKFSFEIKHIWFQFGLACIESRHYQRAILVLQEVARIDPKDPLPCLLISKLYLTEFDDPEKGLEWADRAQERGINETLQSKVYLLQGIANALLYEEATESVKKLRKSHLSESIKNFKAYLKLRPGDHLAYYHLALHMANQRAINDAIVNAHAALVLNPYHLPTIQLLILCLSSLKKYQEALNLCEMALEEFPDHLLLLYIKAHLEQIVSDRGFEIALATAKHMLRCCKLASNEHMPCFNTRLSGTGASYDRMSLRMEQTLSEVVSLESSVDNINANVNNNHHNEQRPLWNMEVNTWTLVTELYINLGLISEAETCAREIGSSIFGPLSHQLMYVKGLIAKARGQLHEAKIYFQNSISINPSHGKALQQLGHTYYLLGNMYSADKYLRDSLSVDGLSHQTWVYASSVLEELGELVTSADCLCTALRLEATAPIIDFQIIGRRILE